MPPGSTVMILMAPGGLRGGRPGTCPRGGCLRGCGRGSPFSSSEGDFILALGVAGRRVVLAGEVGDRAGVAGADAAVRGVRAVARRALAASRPLPTRTMFWASTSVVDRLLPSLSCQLRVRSLPSTRTWRPLSRYFSQNSACLPQTTILCHSVRSLDSLVVRLNTFSLVARVKRARLLSALGQDPQLGLLAEPAEQDDPVQAVDVSHFSSRISLIFCWALLASSSSGYLRMRNRRTAMASSFFFSSTRAIALLQIRRRRSCRCSRIVHDQVVEVLDGLGELLLAVVALADHVEGVVGQGVGRELLDGTGEAVDGQVVVALLIVGLGRVVDVLGREVGPQGERSDGLPALSLGTGSLLPGRLLVRAVSCRRGFFVGLAAGSDLLRRRPRFEDGHVVAQAHQQSVSIWPSFSRTTWNCDGTLLEAFLRSGPGPVWKELELARQVANAGPGAGVEVVRRPASTFLSRRRTCSLSSWMSSYMSS